ncbi:MAG: amino acid ABC transporter ATP-binding protein, partial [Oscillospiraceae bacterium]|nr:amino acid ABC transporter ATP-binding protein [Oscillospiraceae bacterium]
SLNAVRRKMGMVFQSFNLFNHLTVIENVIAAPMDLKKASKNEAWKKGMRLLRTVGLGDRAYSYPDELSGGQKQRAAIARALAMDPSVILLDEPTSALDPTMVGEVQTVIRELTKLGKTMMIVTHEMAFAKAISTRVFYMDEGVIFEEGTPGQIFDHPQKEKTRRFIRRLKVLDLEISSRTYDYLSTMSSITEYGVRNQIPPLLTGHIQLAFEELVHHLILPKLEKPAVRIAVEYAADEEKAVMTVLYGSEPFNPLLSGDTLSLSVIKGITQDQQYSENPAGPERNRITLMLQAQPSVSPVSSP